MENLTSFLVYFGAYLILYLLIILLVIVAVIIGIKLRKNKDAKMPGGVSVPGGGPKEGAS